MGAVERMKLGRDTKLLDALFVSHDPVDAQALAHAGPQLLAAVGATSTDTSAH